MRVGIYARVSTADKEQNPDTQLHPLREFCTAQGWQTVGEFVDKASATDLKGRVSWQRLLDAAANRKVDCILVWKLDKDGPLCRYTGVSLAEAQAVLGHSNPKTTLVYNMVSNTQLRKTMTNLRY